ncbi:MAG: cytochrome P450 [Myxococcaceae bacterium]
MNTESALNAPQSFVPSDDVPGPKGVPFFGVINEFRKDPLAGALKAAREFGDLSVHPLVERVFFASHPDYVKHVLQDNHLNYQKGWVYARIKALTGEGLLTSEGDHWKRQRRLSQPAFHKQRIASFAQTMSDRTKDMVDGWSPAARNGDVIDMHAEMMRLTLRIAGQTLFSVDLGDAAERVGDAFSVVLEILNARTSTFVVFPKSIPTPENVRFARAMKVLDDVVEKVIEQRRHAAPGEHHDLLAMLMESKDADTGETMNDRQLRDELMTMMLAGHETTANALAFSFYLLSKNPGVTRKVIEEVDRVLGGRTPTAQDAMQLQYTLRVIQEAMRLYPPAWIFSRKAIKEDVIGGYRIPAGATVVMSPWALHRDPRFWENPEGFDPDRFTEERSAGRPKTSYVPFAAGPRMCIGAGFALMEAQIILAMVLQRYRPELVAGYDLELEPLVTLRPKGGIQMTLRPAV